jgi:hypothetical protein
LRDGDHGSAHCGEEVFSDVASLAGRQVLHSYTASTVTRSAGQVSARNSSEVPLGNLSKRDEFYNEMSGTIYREPVDRLNHYPTVELVTTPAFLSDEQRAVKER